MAPERFSSDKIKMSSTEGDVYSLAMTSFEVCFSVVNCPTIQCNNQVLTGILPYGGSNKHNVITDIGYGKRPSRPMDPSQNKWLQDRVWDTITTCWSADPGQRYKLSVVHRVFLGYDLQDALGNLNAHNDRNLTIAERS
jgi:hypothetical protein